MEGKHDILETEIITPYAIDSNESLISSNQNEVILNVSDLENKPICRICYAGSSKEQLLRPCKCKGTIEYVHRHCIEKWLETKNAEVCELCHHQYETKRTKKNCWDWLRTPDMSTERRNFIGDCTCFAFLTPLGIATFWLCAEGAIYYQKVKGSTLETVALVTLASFLVVAYFTWIILCTRYHLNMYTLWRERSWNIRIVNRPPSDENNESSNDTFVSLSSDSSQEPVTEQHMVRYAPAINTVEAPIATIDIHDSELITPDSDLRCNKMEK